MVPEPTRVPFFGLPLVLKYTDQVDGPCISPLPVLQTRAVTCWQLPRQPKLLSNDRELLSQLVAASTVFEENEDTATRDIRIASEKKTNR
jgi:hypothetical protein